MKESAMTKTPADELGEEFLTLFEKGNDDERDDTAIELICGPLGDAITIALDRLGWKIVPQHPSDNDRWLMHEPSPLPPSMGRQRQAGRALTPDGRASLVGRPRAHGAPSRR
jgi:hypothetical protein